LAKKNNIPPETMLRVGYAGRPKGDWGLNWSQNGGPEELE